MLLRIYLVYHYLTSLPGISGLLSFRIEWQIWLSMSRSSFNNTMSFDNPLYIFNLFAEDDALQKRWKHWKTIDERWTALRRFSAQRKWFSMDARELLRQYKNISYIPYWNNSLLQVNGGTKVTNVVTYAKNALDKGEVKNVVWSGHGGGVVKTISCAEILKRSYPLYQVTRMCYTR